jgi:hypothetical protein
MAIDFVYFRLHIATKRFIDTAIFVVERLDLSSRSPYQLLSELTEDVKREKMPVDRSLLVVSEGGRRRLFGDNCLVELVLQTGIPRLTHTFVA